MLEKRKWNTKLFEDMGLSKGQNLPNINISPENEGIIS
jgi:hypothetical protein